MSAEDMRKVVGLADGCELMSALTRFPDNDVAAAVASGSVHDDAVGCAKDVAAARDDGRAGDIEALSEGFVCADDEDDEEIGAASRRAWFSLAARRLLSRGKMTRPWRFGGVGLLISFETTRLCGCRIS